MISILTTKIQMVKTENV